ncbi:uncharacterized protein LOC131995869 [Stomoxys calcitrans]|uniref:uncharacterized protein LOC131995869 n=1 Tax=Stomoxys calcitrans TaxID=35570 RepID=UPI0027E306ED|nr:uncharacterized protein LOC131995869 [Stomoxys calcitrans]
MILIQTFNRRRAGEIERLQISNFLNKEVITDDMEKELLQSVSKSSISFAKQYVKISIRGKLGRTVPVLLSPVNVRAIDIILKYRSKAGITNKNQYIFSNPLASKQGKPYFRACGLLRQYSKECGAKIPESLRGTALRKQIATYMSIINAEDAAVDKLADFMGHHKDIHKNVYRTSIPAAEITCVAKILMAAIRDEDDPNEDDPNEDNPNEGVPNDDVPNENNLTENASNEGSPNDFVNGKPIQEKCLSIVHRQKTRIATSELDEELSTDEDFIPSKRKRSTSPFGKTTHRSWKDDEKAAALAAFGDPLLLHQLPSNSECLSAINKCPALSERTPQQLKTWIDNQRRKDIRKKRFQESKLQKQKQTKKKQ